MPTFCGEGAESAVSKTERGKRLPCFNDPWRYSMFSLNTIGNYPPEALRELRGGASNALFDRYPRLSGRVPWRPLGSFPTPVEKMTLSPGAMGVWVKRDDLSSAVYGGNKIRKLEFLLAEAALASRRTLITLGGIGSNHALATAIHGTRLGFEVDLVLYDQPVTQHVRRNLAGFLAAGARLHYAGGTGAAFLAARRLFAQRLREGSAPYFIMVGGTSRLGCLGYVNAGLELASQIDAGEIPKPDVIFVALGTSGTAAGLIAGLKLAGLSTRVAAVRVADKIAANSFALRYFGQNVLDFLHAADPSIPRLRVARGDFEVFPDYIGAGYGHATPSAESALRGCRGQLTLETTYTGKTLAACLDFCAEHARPDNVLFWNTFNSAPVTTATDPAEAPESLRHVLGTS